MSLLTATTTTQGQRANDFNYCVEGELVMPMFFNVCARDRADPDGGCGCGRSFAGLNSHSATTTAMIRDVDGFTHDDLLEAVRSSLEHQGWLDFIADNEVGDIVDDLLELASTWPAGTVLERRLDEVHPRVT